MRLSSVWLPILILCIGFNLPFISFAYYTHREYTQLERVIKNHVKPECRIIGDFVQK